MFDNTNPSILIFKNGEKIISYLQEAYSEEDSSKGVFIIINYPYLLHFIEQADSTEVKIKFEKWCPFSVSGSFKIPYDSVLSIGEPDANISATYSEKIQDYLKTQQVENDQVN